MSQILMISATFRFLGPHLSEAYVKMHGSDILLGLQPRYIIVSPLERLTLDVLLVNQTGNTLQNLCLDFSTL